MGAADRRVEELLLLHAARYPRMEPTDAVKLLYQSEFGGGHLIEDGLESLGRLREEMGTAPADGPLFEELGGDFCRVCLGPAGREAVDAIHRMFLAGAARPRGTMAGLEEKLGVLEELASRGAMPFSAEELAAYLEDYRAKGLPAVSHSAAYRGAYRPAYRVIPAQYRALLPLLKLIDGRLAGGPVTVALDGPCGAGKSTLAAALEELYGCSLIPLDHFFLPPGKRTPERLGEPGGNIDYERFAREVVPYLGGSTPFSYRVFDCGEMVFAGTRTVEPRPLTVCEGSYSQHPFFGQPYDLRVFVTCAGAEQKKRLLARSGAALFERFLREWIPMERSYFEAFHIRDGCDLVIDTTRG